MNEDPELRKIAEESRRLFLLRVELNLANEHRGLTPYSTINIGKGIIWSTIGKNVFQREGDRREFENAEEIVNSAVTKVGQGDRFSAVAKYADMDAADRSAELWQQRLVPWMKKAAGPPASKPLVDIRPQWAGHSFRGVAFQALEELSITNTLKTDLTHVVVEILLENEWKERSAHYYYFPELKAGSLYRLTLHPRWLKRRAPYSCEITMKYSAWTAEASDAGCTVVLKNPKPDPDAEDARRDFGRFDDEYGKMGTDLANRIQKGVAPMRR